MTEALPDFISHLMLDKKVESSTIRLICDNARSQRKTLLLCDSSGSSSISSAPLNDTRFQAINRWNHDSGYDSDTSVMFAGGRRNASSLEPKVTPLASSTTPNKTVRFKNWGGLDFEDKWSKPSSDSCLSIPKRKASLTKNSIEEKEMLDVANGGRPSSGRRLSKSKSPPKQTLQSYQRRSRPASPTTTNPLPCRTPSYSARESRRKRRHHISVDGILSGTSSTVAAADAPTSSNDIFQQRQTPYRSISSGTLNNNGRTRASTDICTNLSSTSFVMDSSLVMSQKVLRPGLKTHSKKSRMVLVKQKECHLEPAASAAATRWDHFIIDCHWDTL
ncbi:hypothetical protein IV203_020094 [Nitzschia inconspicua]|uniref:Uncharacterized protein n=1 Tax=Nitzschia inconspicua TaxID=303405 RepID=A0A9K3K8F6_9STRA|nr:hypothetical protein IV203_020464 [Nitzschia inconspicua]KAG7371524.1 hypothetical protein IV203_020094 [Nitzschia inconspicua]